MFSGNDLGKLLGALFPLAIIGFLACIVVVVWLVVWLCFHLRFV